MSNVLDQPQETTQEGRMGRHEIIKMRKEPVRRKLQVATKEFITPRMLRIVFHSDELQGFDSPSPDDHIKIFIPVNGAGEQAMRDFTPRAWDFTSGSFTIDFALHNGGAAIEWAQAARPGDVLEIGGPRGSTVVTDDFDWYFLIGDATALPSFARRLESLRRGVLVHTFVLVSDAAEQQSPTTESICHAHWLACGRNADEDASTLSAALGELPLPQGDGFIWIAAESSVSRKIHRYLVEDRNHPAAWIKAAAYWTESSN